MSKYFWKFDSLVLELFKNNECLCEFSGQDVAVIAFGDHLSGKTQTIFGRNFDVTKSESLGILPRAISYIFGLFNGVNYLMFVDLIEIMFHIRFSKH